MAKLYNDIIDQGASYELEATWTDANGDVIDISGYTVAFAIKRTFADADDIIRFTEADEEVTINGPEGTITILISPADTGGMPAGRWPWDLLITDPATGRANRVFDGHVTVRPRAA
jgi:hypothetical protein